MDRSSKVSLNLPRLLGRLRVRPGMAGFSIFGVDVRRRVVVFIDYQNVYMGARSAFDLARAPSTNGQINPLALGQLLVERSGSDRFLAGVRVYRGLPSLSRNPIGGRAAMLQKQAWQREPLVEVTTRPLAYRHDGSAIEKGIDVALAVDVVAMAMADEFDIGIVFSADSDVLPALEVVGRRTLEKRMETALWKPNGGRLTPLRFSQGLGLSQPWCHFLDRSCYELVADEFNYASQKSRRR